MFGGTFFAVPLFLASAGVVPSLLIGAAAFGASELILSDDEKEQEVKVGNRNIKEVLTKAKNDVNSIRQLINQVDDRELQVNIQDICITSDRIINTVGANPSKLKRCENFFDYYLPITLKIVKRYDDIENQRLTSSDSTKFMTQTKALIKETKHAFEKQLSSLYQSEIVDIDAEMKVFDMMLKADGLDSNSLNTGK